MSKKMDSESIISRMQQQLDKKDPARRFSKDFKGQAKPSKSYTTSFLNSQLRNKSFDNAKSDSLESFGAQKPEGDRKYIREKEKLHETFSHHKDSVEEFRSKSQYLSEMNPDEPKKEKNIKLSDYFQKCEDLMLRVDKDDKSRPGPTSAISQFQDLAIQDISSLIQLIDTCVEQANSYITDLTLKMEKLAEESDELKRINRRLQEMNKTHQVVIREKDQQINRLSKSSKAVNRNDDLKNLLKVIQQLSEQNTLLKRQIDVLKSQQLKAVVTQNTRNKRDMYNQIHRKIDILNISIGREEDRGSESHTSQDINDVNQEQYVSKDDTETHSSIGRKYKYIKPKSQD